MSKKLELLTKQVAADRLNLSVRRLQELAAAGKFTRHRRFDPETKREVFMFDAAEVQAMADLKEYNVAPAPAAVRPIEHRVSFERAPAASDRKFIDSRPVDYRAADAAARVNAALAVRERRPPLDEYDIDTPRPWLTIDEAAAYSGLPASYLLGLIMAGELKARNVGPRPGGRWRVRKLDLDAIAGVSALIPL
jgi:excisionase family DNA binding protein